MRPTTVSSTVDVPREQVFDYLCDVANHAEFTDHFLEDFRLERLDSRGVGAAAAFKIAYPLSRLWGEAVMTEAERPHRIAFEGRTGRRGRVRLSAVYVLTLHGQGMTRVELTLASEPATRIDALREALGGRLWLKSMCRRALRRLRATLEEGEPSAYAVRVAPG